MTRCTSNYSNNNVSFVISPVCKAFASGTSGFMYHLHDDPPDNDMLPEIVNNRFRYTNAATGDASW
jgi:hypothetical protein